MERTNINPKILQAMLDCAPNAGAKGQSQFFTPIEWGQRMALPLPRVRKTIVDLNCGGGHLLQACANKTTQFLLGSDIDPCLSKQAPKIEPAARLNRVTADATLFYPILSEIDLMADLWVLNPPWDLHFWRDRLPYLADSDLPAVRAAFAAHDGRTSAETIDSTIAMLLIALDRCTYCGEGVLIGNNATVDRLLFAPGAPHAALAPHIWARVVIAGNPMTGLDDCSFEDAFQTGVIYFARGHELGMRVERVLRNSSGADASAAFEAVASLRDRAREGPRIIDSWHGCRDTITLWSAAAEEWTARQTQASARTDYNLWLDETGEIKTNLSLYEERSIDTGKSKRILKEQAAKLHALNGRRPMELVLQRSQRELLLQQCHLPVPGDKTTGQTFPWRVQERLKEAVLAAVKEYHACRAPLYPLPGLQRLAYLEEEDAIVCKKDLAGPDGTLLFRAGQIYPLATESMIVTRQGWKPNLAAEMEEVEYSGAELGTYITDDTGRKRCFMEARLREENVRIDDEPALTKIDFTLQQLEAHFPIPDVPDVAALNPELFQRNVALLEELELLLNL